MTLSITPLYAMPLVILFIAVSSRVIRYRRANSIPLGDAADRELLSRVRAQANCAEYMPFGLLLVMMAERAGAPVLGLHIVGVTLALGRIIHAAHLSYLRTIYGLRVLAITMTFASYLVAAALSLL